MMTFEELMHRLPEIEARMHYTFKDKQLLILAFVHRSFFNENRELVKAHNERVEFLGDSVLGLVVSDFLYNFLPGHAEGDLSHLRSHFVGATSCAEFVQRLMLSDYVLLGKGEQMNRGRGRERILADLFEAVVGSIYLDGGIEAAKQFILGHFTKDLELASSQPQRNWKAELQDHFQKKYQKLPEYQILEETGPDHHKHFVVSVSIGGKELGRGEGLSKKLAEQAAAQDAVGKLEHG